MGYSQIIWSAYVHILTVSDFFTQNNFLKLQEFSRIVLCGMTELMDQSPCFCRGGLVMSDLCANHCRQSEVLAHIT